MGDIYHLHEVYAGSVPINDSDIGDDTVWSSSKIQEFINTQIQTSIQTTIQANIQASKSHVGMIIHSTTLSTLAKVQEVYGTNTVWIQHTGYFLRGASSGVVANSAKSTGGADSVTLTVQQIPSHNHGGYTNETGSHTHSIRGYGAKLQLGSVAWRYGEGEINDAKVINSAGNHKHTITAQGGGQSHTNVPVYKSVYIWERTK